MNFSKIFIERPVATIALTLGLILFGWLAYCFLPVSELPNVNFATITVSASLPGADPQTMASVVATPLEKQFSNIAGLNSMNSTNTLGATRITLQFNLGRNIDAAAQDVQNAISQAAHALPSEMTSLPTLRKVNPAASPVLYLALTADHLPLSTLDELAETQVGERVSMVSGVAQVVVMGSQQFAVRIHFNPQALMARGMDINDAIADVQAINTHQPAGTLLTPDRNYLLETDGQLNNAAEFSHAILAYRDGMPVRLQDVANVEDGVANDQQGTWLSHERSIVLAVQAQPDANVISVIDGVKKLLPELSQNLPGGAHMKIFYDRSVFINADIMDVKISLLMAVLFVGGVLLLFLGNLRATVIALLVLPASLLGTFGAMYCLGDSIDTLSLMGMVLAVGFIVDDAIVVIENISRYLEKGCSKIEAALKGSQEIGFTILSMTLSLAAVFLPILFMGGLIGRLFNEFAVVVAVSILISGVLSLTLTPMLCSRLLKSDHSGSGRKLKGFEFIFNQVRMGYEKSLRVVLKQGHWVLWGTLILIILTAVLFENVNKGFIPTEDVGVVFGSSEVPMGVPYDQFVTRQQALVNLILNDPNVESLVSSVSGADNGHAQSNEGQFQITLKPANQRSLTADQVIQELRIKLAMVPGINVSLRNPPAIHAGGAVSRSTYQYVLESTDFGLLEKYSETLANQIKTLPGIQDVSSDLEMTNPAIELHILRSKAASLGITPVQIETSLYNAYGERQISSIYTPTDEYEVISDVDPAYRSDPSVLNNFYLKSNSGQLVPLNAVTEMSQKAEPVSMNHYDQLPAVILSFNISPGASLGTVSQEVAQTAQAVLPDGISGHFIGSAQAFEDSMHSLPLLLLITIVVIYLVLAILYEHFGHPLTILTALPFAGFGALLMLFIFHKELDIFSFVGIILLVGLVKKNGIMMIDFALEAKRELKLSSYEAIVQASVIRFRPIMMTTFSAIMAALPMAVGWGAGGETREAMGIAVMGGLIFSQFLTLYVTPVFYLYMEKWTAS